jgi:hypothetical protein
MPESSRHRTALHGGRLFSVVAAIGEPRVEHFVGFEPSAPRLFQARETAFLYTRSRRY